MATVKRLHEVDAIDVSDGMNYVGVTKQLVIGPSDGETTPTFAVRLFTVKPGGHTARHRHPFEHGVLVLEGMGIVLSEDKEAAIGPGAIVVIHPDEEHQLRNTNTMPLRFLCIVPRHVEEASAR